MPQLLRWQEDDMRTRLDGKRNLDTTPVAEDELLMDTL